MSDVAVLSNQSPEHIVSELGREAKAASQVLANTSTENINAALHALSQALLSQKEAIFEANKKDLVAAEERGLNAAMIDRLRLTEDRLADMAEGIKTVASLDDPTNKVLWEQSRPNGLKIQRVSCPIGVLGMIYESRPNVTIDASILCLKSHNSVILRGGSESLNSSLALHKVIQDTLEIHNIPKASVSMIPTKDRAAVGAMLRADQFIDIMIPRGGHGLIERVMSEARMPVFGHLDGICHVYIDKSANAQAAKDIAVNAKMRRTGICGAMETLLFDRDVLASVAQDVLTSLLDSGCTVVGDQHVQDIDSRIGAANEEDWSTEYLDAKVSCKFVDGVEDATDHINHYGSHHTDSIIAEDIETVRYFQNNVDSGIVMHNASTQFADGGEFGMGAEIGIATGKMHARGPVGLEQLCTYKYLVHGNGQTRP